MVDRVCDSPTAGLETVGIGAYGECCKMSRASTGPFFAPYLDYDQYDEELAGILRCIVWAVNELHQALSHPKKLEPVLFMVRVRHEEDWEEEIVSVFAKIEAALLEIRGAIVDNAPIRCDAYHFELDPDEYETELVQFVADLKGSLNELRSRIVRTRSRARQRTLFDVSDEDDGTKTSSRKIIGEQRADLERNERSLLGDDLEMPESDRKKQRAPRPDKLQAAAVRRQSSRTTVAVHPEMVRATGAVIRDLAKLGVYDFSQFVKRLADHVGRSDVLKHGRSIRKAWDKFRAEVEPRATESMDITQALGDEPPPTPTDDTASAISPPDTPARPDPGAVVTPTPEPLTWSVDVHGGGGVPLTAVMNSAPAAPAAAESTDLRSVEPEYSHLTNKHKAGRREQDRGISAGGKRRSFRPFSSVDFDPVITFGLDRERVRDAAYRRRSRKELLNELQMTDEELLERDGKQVSRNQLVEGFNLLDMAIVREYLDRIDASTALSQLWIHGAAANYDTKGWKANWLDLVDHPVHVQFRVRWRVQWASAVQAAFDKPVNAESFRKLIACCEADPSFGIVCYEPVLMAASHLQTRVNELAEAVEAESTDEQDIDALLCNAARFRLLGCLPVSCNRVKSECAHALHQLSVQLHNSGCSDSRPIACLELAREITADCEVGEFYHSELHKLRKIQVSVRDWELLNKFAAALQALIKAIEKERPWSSIQRTIEAINRKKSEFVQAANRLSEDENEDTTEMRDWMAKMLLIVAARALACLEGERFVIALLEAANSLQCSADVKAEIEDALAKARRNLPAAYVWRNDARDRQATLSTGSNVKGGGVFWFLACLAVLVLLTIAMESCPSPRVVSTRAESAQQTPNSSGERGRAHRFCCASITDPQKRSRSFSRGGWLPITTCDR